MGELLLDHASKHLYILEGALIDRKGLPEHAKVPRPAAIFGGKRGRCAPIDSADRLAQLGEWLVARGDEWPKQRGGSDSERALAQWVKDTRRQSASIQAEIQKLKDRYPVAAAGKSHSDAWFADRLGKLKQWLAGHGGLWPNQRSEDEFEQILAVWVIKTPQHPAAS